MVFSSEKKELWRYASRNNANCAAGAVSSRSQQLHHHQHLHRLQSPPPDYYSTTNDRLNISLQQYQQQQQQQLQLQLQQHQDQSNYNTPPPPYSSVPCGIDYSLNACRRMSTSNSSNCGIEGDIEVGGEGSGSVDRYSIGGSSSSSSFIDGKSSTCRSLSNRSIAPFNNINNNNNLSMQRNNQHDFYYSNNKNNNVHYNNGADIMYDFLTYDQLSKTTTPTTMSVPLSQQSATMTATTTTTSTTTTNPVITSTASVLAATAATIFRNCCGGGNSDGGATVITGRPEESTTNPATAAANICQHTNNNIKNYHVLTPRLYFDALIKQLKEGQVTSMLKAVKSRVELVSTLQQPNSCILVHRSPILNEEPHVIACRLFFWYDLKDANELKRLPSCPNASDPVYVCCNPLHWCRIFKAGTSNKSTNQPKHN